MFDQYLKKSLLAVLGGGIAMLVTLAVPAAGTEASAGKGAESALAAGACAPAREGAPKSSGAVAGGVAGVWRGAGAAGRSPNSRR